MKRYTGLVLACSLMAFMTLSADVVLMNDPTGAGIDVKTNGLGVATLFPEGCSTFTVEAWVKPSVYQTALAVYNPIFSINPTTQADHSRYIFGICTNTLSLFHGEVNSGDRFPVSRSVIPLNQWTHVAAVHTATSVKYYINGVLDSTAEGSYKPAVSEYGLNHLTIGGYHSLPGLDVAKYGSARVFQGAISDIRVWTVERSAEEIAGNRGRRLRGDEPGLLVYAPFDDASGNVAQEMVTGQSLVAPPSMQFVEDSSLSLSPAEARRVGEGYLGCVRVTDDHGATAIVTDVDFENKSDGTGPDFTFETWVRIGGSSWTDRWLMSKYATSGDTGWIGLDIMGQSLTAQVVISGERMSICDVATNEWVHLAATRSGSTYCVYTNGVLVQSGTCKATGFDSANAAAKVKLLNAGTSSSFGGDVKEMRIWNVARTADQIAAYYDKAATGREEGLVGCWAMSEGYGSNVVNKATGVEQPLGNCMGFCSGRHITTTSRAQSIETDVKLTTKDFTLEAWVRDNSPTPRSETSWARSYIFSQFQSNTDWVSLCFENATTLYPGLRIGSGTGTFVSGTAIRKGEWFHLAATREGSAVKVYLNGTLVKEGTYESSLAVPNAQLTFGALAGANGHVGDIREARAWNYARSQDQIRKCMYGGVTGGESGLVGWWPFSEGPSMTKIVNRKTNGWRTQLPAGVWHGRDGSPLLSTPKPEPKSEPEWVPEQAADFGGGWFTVARTGVAVDVGDFTFETWVHPRSYPFTQSFLFAQYSETEGANNPNRFLMGIVDTCKLGVFIGSAGWKTAESPIPLNRWTHVAATREGSTLRMYVNGKLDATFENYTTLSPYSAEHPHALTLGGVDGSYNYYEGIRNNVSRSFDGLMREARVWNRALSANEIADSSARVASRGSPGLVGYWPLDGADKSDKTRLVNKAPGRRVGSILAGWRDVEPLCLLPPHRSLVLRLR